MTQKGMRDPGFTILQICQIVAGFPRSDFRFVVTLSEKSYEVKLGAKAPRFTDLHSFSLLLCKE